MGDVGLEQLNRGVGMVNEETSTELTNCGIALMDGWLGYSRTYTIKPAVRVADGYRVAVKLYNDTTRPKQFGAAKPKPKTQKKDDIAAEYAREMNIVVSVQR